MPNLRNAKKALEQSKVRAVRNANVKGHIDSLRRGFRKLLEAGKFEDAKVLINELNKAMDKSVTKHVLKANTAARVKSRTMKALNKAIMTPAVVKTKTAKKK